jgi:hypothetical protein
VIAAKLKAQTQALPRSVNVFDVKVADGRQLLLQVVLPHEAMLP